MSFDKLTKELSSQKPRLNKFLSYLPHLPEKLPENIDLMREILDLTKEVSYNEAGKRLEAKYGNRLTFSTDYNTIQKYKKRMLRYIANLPSNPYMKSYIEEELNAKDK